MAAFTSVDGALIEIDGLSVDQYGATTFAVWAGDLGRHEFSVGALEFGEVAARREGLTLTEEYTLLSGHRVRTGSRTATDHVTKVDVTTVLGVWLGADFSAHMWLTSGDPASKSTLTAKILTIFNQFRFSETATGIVMTPVAGSFSLVRDAGAAPDIARHIEGLGLVHAFERTPQQEFVVPSTPGEPVAGGHLWVEGVTIEKAQSPEDLQTDPNLTLLLVGESAIARINPALDKVSEARLLERSSSLTVGWKGGVFA